MGDNEWDDDRMNLHTRLPHSCDPKRSDRPMDCFSPQIRRSIFSPLISGVMRSPLESLVYLQLETRHEQSLWAGRSGTAAEAEAEPEALHEEAGPQAELLETWH